LLAHLWKSKVPFAIATSGRLESAGPVLKLLDLHPDVPAITRDQVRYAKPDPHLFLAAARHLGVAIENSFVVGDGCGISWRHGAPAHLASISCPEAAVRKN
jgi:beta-phosphoglucomutase-like phosphatase (HAD superfamily)